MYKWNILHFLWEVKHANVSSPLTVNVGNFTPKNGAYDSTAIEAVCDEGLLGSIQLPSAKQLRTKKTDCFQLGTDTRRQVTDHYQTPDLGPLKSSVFQCFFDAAFLALKRPYRQIYELLVE